MKKVLVTGISGIYGGQENIILNLIKELPELEFEFLCFGKENEKRREMLAGKRVYYVTATRKDPLRSYAEQKKFWLENGSKYDYVWINLGSASNITSHKLARKYSKAKIVTHCHSSRIEHSVPLLRAFHYLRHYINRSTLVKLTDVRLTCSDKAARHLYGKNVDAVMINNGIDTAKYKFDPEKRAALRKALSVADDERIMVMTGRLAQVKNPFFALNVLQRLVERDGKYKLLFVGDGELREELALAAEEKNISAHVLFAGFQKEVEAYLCASDVFILPSFFEGLPVSAVEAQSSGLPCLISETVTRSVELTPLVKYLPIGEENTDKWADEAARACLALREGCASTDGLYPFDIKNTAEQFLKALE